MISNERIKVLVVDDHSIVREGLKYVLEQSGEFEVVGQAGDGVEAVRVAAELSPDLVVMDVMMPRKDGVEACREIMDSAPETRVVMLTVASEETAVLEAVAAGATGYLQKETDRERLLSTLRGVFRGELRLPAEAVRGVVAALRGVSEAGDAADAAGLTAKGARDTHLFCWGHVVHPDSGTERRQAGDGEERHLRHPAEVEGSRRYRASCYGQRGTGCWRTMTRRVRAMRTGNQRCSERETAQGSRYSRGVHLVTTAANVLGITGWERSDGDPDGLRLIARTFVWVRWFVVAFGLVLWVYRPVDWLETYAVYVPGLLLLVGLNGYTHYRLVTKKAVTRGWILANATLDVFILSNAIAASGGFSHNFWYLLYYPQLAGYAVILASFWLTMLCATFVAVLYLIISLTFGDSIDIAATEERTLFARIWVMYAVAAIVNIIAKFERMRWRHAVERERELQRERVEFSQSIHDTTAQSAYMIGLGIDTARAQAGDHQP